MTNIIQGNAAQGIVYTDPNEPTCHIVIPVAGIDPNEELNKLLEKYKNGEYPHNIVNPRIINYPEDIPNTRLFRMAWTDSGTTVIEDLGTATNIHMERIREVRNQQLSSTDSTYIKALSKNDSKGLSDIATKKQMLRDIPQNTDLSGCSTITELLSVWPADLPQHPVYEEAKIVPTETTKPVTVALGATPSVSDNSTTTTMSTTDNGSTGSQ